MAVAEVKRIELYAHRSVVEPIMARLQVWGRCEITAPDTGVSAPSGDAANGAALADLRYATRFLTPWYDDPIGSIGRMLGERPFVTTEDLERLATTVDLDGLVKGLRAEERHLLELKSNLAQSQGLAATLKTLEGLSCPLSMVTQGTAQVAAFLGTGSPEALTAWHGDVLAALGDDVDCTLHLPVGKDMKDETPWGLAIYRRAREEALQTVTLKSGVVRLDVPDHLRGSPAEERDRLETRCTQWRSEVEAVEGRLGDFARAHMTTFRQLLDYYANLEDRRMAQSKSEHTEAVVVIRGWVAADGIEGLKNLLSPWSDSIELQVITPDPEENIPVVLKNPYLAQPAETLTKLYGAPRFDGVDPSVPMLPFFMLFFGMCYGDAGYGIVLTLLVWWAMHRYKNMPEEPKRFMRLLYYCGWATIVVGALTGGWMGNMVEQFSFLHFLVPIVKKMTLIEPMKNAMGMLAISLVLGLIHIYLGLFLGLFADLRRGQWVAALGDKGGWIVLVSGLLTWGLAAATGSSAVGLGQSIALAGAVILILTQGRDKPTLWGKAFSGVMSLYNVSSYLGDVLSYSRLLALGMVGAAVAMIINLLSSMLAGVPYVGWLLAVVLFVGGQIFSMVINILGAFVHPLRLQYLEFFGKFYETGGTMLDPLRYKTQYVNLVPSKTC